MPLGTLGFPESFPGFRAPLGSRPPCVEADRMGGPPEHELPLLCVAAGSWTQRARGRERASQGGIEETLQWAVVDD